MFFFTLSQSLKGLVSTINGVSWNKYVPHPFRDIRTRYNKDDQVNKRVILLA
jgi:hypothetical protein